MLITPFVMYLVWNAVVVLVEAAWWVDRKRGTVVVVAVGAVVRLLWLVPLTTNDLGRWPWLIVPLVDSIASAVTAILAVLPESLPGDGQAGAPGKVT